MNNLVLSTKDKQEKALLSIQVVWLIMWILIGIICIFFGSSILNNFSGDEKTVGYVFHVIGFVCFIMCAFPLMKIISYPKTYIDIFDDHVEGMGLTPGLNSKVLNFNAKIDQISSVSNENGIITIIVGVSTFKILTTREIAPKVLNTINSTK